MYSIFRIILLTGALFSANAVTYMRGIHTASNNILVVYLNSTVKNIDAVDSTPTAWKVNDAAPLEINRYVVPADRADHFVFLTVETLQEGKTYKISTPHGDTTITFSDRNIFCESIKTNQAAYSALSKNNFANFSIWLGGGGGRDIKGEPPKYDVFEQFTGKTVASGTLKKIGASPSSGDTVYRIDLSSVPEGGPYKIAVKGYGCSYPFGIGGAFSKRLAHIMFRGQYYQRCGCPIIKPYGLDIRKTPCHTKVYKVDGKITEANNPVSGSEESFACYGGYHDAGDADRRVYHMANPIINLMLYETFPDLFTDNQFNIPDKFDSEYNIIGKGNGIPDIIDEAAWGTLVWEYLQNDDGSISYGTETTGYPSPFNIPMDKDDLLYGTVKADDRAAATGAGLFMHLARILKPFDEARAKKLVERAEKAYSFIGTRIKDPENLYYNIQKYLYDGDEAAHAKIKELKTSVDNYDINLFECHGYMLNDTKFDNPGYIMSYILEKERTTEPDVVAYFKDAIKKAADVNLAELDKYAYPVANNPTGTRWGHNVMQTQYAGAPILHWKLSGEQKYFDGAAAMINYALGQNPLGISFVTGVGFHLVVNPHDRESQYSAKTLKIGPKPGITVFGPGIHQVFSTSGELITYPDKSLLPIERLFGDNREAISMTEFTIFQTMHYYGIYTVLAGGGTWDESVDPFADPTLVRQRNPITTRRSNSHSIGTNGTIAFSLTNAGRIRASFFQVDGRLAGQFTTSKLPAGNHILTVPLDRINRSSAGSSVLLCQIAFEDGSVQVARIMITR